MNGEVLPRPVRYPTLLWWSMCLTSSRRPSSHWRRTGPHPWRLADNASEYADPNAPTHCGTIARSNPDNGDDLRERAEQLAIRTDVDATAIWEWGTIHRVMAGLFSRRIGLQPFGDLLLAEADRLTSGRRR